MNLSYDGSQTQEKSGSKNERISSDDTEIFLKRLGLLIGESSTACYAWALMYNHAHLLLRTGLVPISLVMRSLNPVRARVIGDMEGLNTYPLCGHSALMGRMVRQWQDVALEPTLMPGRCKRRELARARALICTQAVDRLQISGREVSRRLKLTPAAISKLAQRG